MKTLKRFIVPVLLACSVFSLGSCGGSEEKQVQNLACENNTTLGTYGTQEVELKFTSEYGQTVSTFKSTISASDINLKYRLTGRTASSVTYVNESTIKVVLGGDCRTASQESDIVEIGVNGKGITNGIGGYCTFLLKDPYIETISASVKSKVYSSTYSMLSGSFISTDLTPYITYNSESGEMAISKEDNGDVTIKVTSFTATETQSYPEISFLAGSNDLGLLLTSQVGRFVI